MELMSICIKDVCAMTNKRINNLHPNYCFITQYCLTKHFYTSGSCTVQLFCKEYQNGFIFVILKIRT